MRTTVLGALPPFTIGPLRSALEQQGFPGAIITDRGELNTEVLLPALVDTIEMRSEWTPPITMSVRGLVSGPPNPLWKQLKPTLTLTGSRIGKQVIAPYGVAKTKGSNDALVVLGLSVLGIFGVGTLFGMFVNR